jgi:hypothetical protein
MGESVARCRHDGIGSVEAADIETACLLGLLRGTAGSSTAIRSSIRTFL